VLDRSQTLNRLRVERKAPLEARSFTEDNTFSTYSNIDS